MKLYLFKCSSFIKTAPKAEYPELIPLPKVIASGNAVRNSSIFETELCK